MNGRGNGREGISVINLYKFCGRPKYVSIVHIKWAKFHLRYADSVASVVCGWVNEWISTSFSQIPTVRYTWAESNVKRNSIWFGAFKAANCLCDVDGDSYSLYARSSARRESELHFYICGAAFCSNFLRYFTFIGGLHDKCANCTHCWKIPFGCVLCTGWRYMRWCEKTERNGNTYE